MTPLITLLLAINSEIVSTIALRESQGFSKPLPTFIALVGFIASLFFLSLALKTMPVGTLYALWAGIGTAATLFISYLLYHEVLTVPQLLGVGLIMIGVILLNQTGSPQGI
jgi:multidrug transporter EmrE-like cation transporter